MTLDQILQILGNLNQVTATILSIYLAIVTFTLVQLVRNQKAKTVNSNRFSITLTIVLIDLLLIFLNIIFFYNSVELGILDYLPVIILLVGSIVSLILFYKTKEDSSLDNVLISLTSLFAISSFIIGFILISQSIYMMSIAEYVKSSDIDSILKYFKLLLILVLNSILYLLIFIPLRKFSFLNKLGKAH